MTTEHSSAPASSPASPRRPARVFSIEPGAPFLATFAQSLLDGDIIPSFGCGCEPFELARAKIYVPTRRAARALAGEIAARTDGRSTLLPAILPLGALDAQEAEFGFAAAPLDDPLAEETPRAAEDIERRMILCELALAWARQLKQAIVTIDADGGVHHAPESLLVAATPADAWRLAGDMTALIDEMIVENVGWRGLDELGAGEFDDYWRITLRFLDIAISAWPAIQKARGFVDAARRRQIMIERAINSIARENAPVMAIGSTGSHKATADLLAAIARAPKGAVVLPGLDQRLDPASFALIGATGEACATHPQALLARLIKHIGVEREDVRPLGATHAPLRARATFVSEAFRPAETTQLWRSWRERQSAEALHQSLAGVALIEAEEEREEALALAIVLREALETPGRTAALITPDRALAERVRLELGRWGVVIDDSGGAPLAASRAGALARLALLALSGDNVDCAALLAHPDVARGLGDARQNIVELLEIGVLRSGLFAADRTLAGRIEQARSGAADKRAHPAQKALAPDDWAAIARAARTLDEAFAPLRRLGSAGLGAWIDAHMQALSALAGRDTGAFPGDDGEELALLFAQLRACANETMTFDAASYRDFFDVLVAEHVVRGQTQAHPRLKILGLLEARLMSADLVALAGLDENVWPPQAQNDCFLNRPMRVALGLSSPERRLGQTAHDFTQSLGAARVVLSRAKKRGGSPTVASRFLLRMAALAGKDVWRHVGARGDRWLELAREIDRPERETPIKRPRPIPALSLRPDKLSVTRIEMLRRDPYAVYAEYILKLAVLPPLDAPLGLREIGVGLHAALDEFARSCPTGPLPADARARIVALARQKLTAFADDPTFQAFRWPRLLRGIDDYLDFETRRRPFIKRLILETRGRLPIPLADGSIFHLTAQADRIELLDDGTAVLVDYKTGAPPTNAQVRAGFSPQLTLEATMAERGAFADVPATPVRTAFYLGLGGGSDGGERELAWKDESFESVVARHFADLKDLLDQFRDPTSFYPPRPFPQFAAKYNDYDHLARTREWSATGGLGSGEDA